MSVAKKEAKGDSLIRALAAKASNKSCFNCLKPGTQRSVCLTIGTFICDQCAGRQRGLAGFQTGTISARTFSEKEAAVFERSGNKKARKIWMNGWDDAKLAGAVAACGDDPTKWTQHLTAIFIEKKYYRENGDTAPAEKAHAPASNPAARHNRTPSGAGTPAGAAPANGAAGERRPSNAAPGTEPVKHTSSAAKSAAAPAAAAPAAAPAPAPVQELSLLDESILSAVAPVEAVGKPEKKAQSRAMKMPEPEPVKEDDFDPFNASPQPAAATATATPQTPVPAAASNGAANALSSPIPVAVTVKALKDCLAMIQTRGGFTVAQLRQYTLIALDEMARGAATASATPGSAVSSPAGVLQPGMPSPATAIISTPAAAASAPTPAPTPITLPNKPELGRLPSLGSLMGAGAWAVESTPASAPPAVAKPTPVAATAAVAPTNPFAFDDDNTTAGGGGGADANPFAFGSGSNSSPALAPAAANAPPAFGGGFPFGAAAAPNSAPRNGANPYANGTPNPFALTASPTPAGINASPYGLVTPTPAAFGAPTPASTPFGLVTPQPAPTAAGAGAMYNPYISPAPIAAPAPTALQPAFLQLLQSNPALLQQFIASMGYNPLLVSAPTAAAPLSTGPAPFVASGPLAGVQPLTVKQPAGSKPAEPEKAKPDLFSAFNPLNKSNA